MRNVAKAGGKRTSKRESEKGVVSHLSRHGSKGKNVSRGLAPSVRLLGAGRRPACPSDSIMGTRTGPGPPPPSVSDAPGNRSGLTLPTHACDKRPVCSARRKNSTRTVARQKRRGSSELAMQRSSCVCATRRARDWLLLPLAGEVKSVPWKQ